MIPIIAKLLHLPALETAADWRRLHVAGGHAVDEDDVKRVAVKLRNAYDAMRKDAVLVPRAVLEQVKEALRKEMDPDLLKLPCVPGCQNPACLALAALEALGE